MLILSAPFVINYQFLFGGLAQSPDGQGRKGDSAATQGVVCGPAASISLGKGFLGLSTVDFLGQKVLC